MSGKNHSPFQQFCVALPEALVANIERHTGDYGFNNQSAFVADALHLFINRLKTKIQFITTTPFATIPSDGPPMHLPVAVWRSGRNTCEVSGEGQDPCTPENMLYLGTTEGLGRDDQPKFCPRHFAAMHTGSDAPYRLARGKQTVTPKELAQFLKETIPQPLNQAQT